MQPYSPPTAVAPALTEEPGPRLTFPRPVAGADVLWMLVGILSGLLSGVLVMVLLLFAGASDALTVTAGLGVLSLLVVAGTWWALARRGWTRADLGLVRGRRSLWHLCWELPVVWLGMMLLVALSSSLLVKQPERDDSNFEAALGLGAWAPLAVVVIVVAVVVIAPLLEEVVFRRMLLGWLERRIGWWPGLLLQAVVFGAVHVSLPVVLLAFFLGLAAALLVRWHGSLWASIALHAMNNAIATAAIFALLI